MYAGEAFLECESYAAAISVGTNPTFDGEVVQVEAFLLDFTGDVYDQPIRLEFHHPVRPQKKFASTAELVEQITQDVAVIRRLCAEHAGEVCENGSNA